jgi:hypothetical protein
VERRTLEELETSSLFKNYKLKRSFVICFAAEENGEEEEEEESEKKKTKKE